MLNPVEASSPESTLCGRARLIVSHSFLIQQTLVCCFYFLIHTNNYGEGRIKCSIRCVVGFIGVICGRMDRYSSLVSVRVTCLPAGFCICV